jgi:hypothetical protein
MKCIAKLQAADIFQLGLIMYEIPTGQPLVRSSCRKPSDAGILKSRNVHQLVTFGMIFDRSNLRSSRGLTLELFLTVWPRLHDRLDHADL